MSSVASMYSFYPYPETCLYTKTSDVSSNVTSFQLEEHQHGEQKSKLMSKVDPSFKSKRYRDKLRTEIKALEALLPVDKAALHRKLDSQTVFRLVLAYFRTKRFLAVAGISGGDGVSGPPKDSRIAMPVGASERQVNRGQLEECFKGQDILQALDGFLVVLASDGTILFVSRNILQHLGFNQVDLMHRCIYGIVHPDDHHELKVILENSMMIVNDVKASSPRQHSEQQHHKDDQCRLVSFLCRIRCFNGTTTGYLKMHCSGHMRAMPYKVKSMKAPCHVLFALFRPFLATSTDPSIDTKNNSFWTKHELDLKLRHMDQKVAEVIGYQVEELEGKSLYSFVHPEDLSVFSACHRSLIQSEEIQTIYFRFEAKNGQWVWMHTRGKVVFKNSKKYSIVFTHCPIREEDSTFVQQESNLRQRYALLDLMYPAASSCSQTRELHPGSTFHTAHGHLQESGTSQWVSHDVVYEPFHDNHSQCPSSWHANTDRHSPIFPSTHTPHKYHRDRHALVPETTKKRQSAEATMKNGPNVPFCSKRLQSNQRNCSLHNLTGPGPHMPCQRQYHMQFNGIGVGPSTLSTTDLGSATTVVFRGNLTAIETPNSQLLPPLCWAAKHTCLSSTLCNSEMPESYGTMQPNCMYTYEHTPSSWHEPRRIPCRYLATTSQIKSCGLERHGRGFRPQTDVCTPLASQTVRKVKAEIAGTNEQTCQNTCGKAFQQCAMSCHSNVVDGDSIQPVDFKSCLFERPDFHDCMGSPGLRRTDDVDMVSHMKIVECQSSSVRSSTAMEVELPSVGNFLEYLNEVQ